MKIKGITLGHLHDAEYIQFVRQILDKPPADLISSINPNYAIELCNEV